MSLPPEKAPPRAFFLFPAQKKRGAGGARAEELLTNLFPHSKIKAEKK